MLNAHSVVNVSAQEASMNKVAELEARVVMLAECSRLAGRAVHQAGLIGKQAEVAYPVFLKYFIDRSEPLWKREEIKD